MASLAVDLGMLVGRTAADSRNCIEGILAGHRFGRSFGSHHTEGCNHRTEGTVGIAAGKSLHLD